MLADFLRQQARGEAVDDPVIEGGAQAQHLADLQLVAHHPGAGADLGDQEQHGAAAQRHEGREGGVDAEHADVGDHRGAEWIPRQALLRQVHVQLVGQQVDQLEQGPQDPERRPLEQPARPLEGLVLACANALRLAFHRLHQLGQAQAIHPVDPRAREILAGVGGHRDEEVDRVALLQPPAPAHLGVQVRVLREGQGRGAGDDVGHRQAHAGALAVALQGGQRLGDVEVHRADGAFHMVAAMRRNVDTSFMGAKGMSERTVGLPRPADVQRRASRCRNGASSARVAPCELCCW